LEFNVPFQHKYGYIRDETNGTYEHITNKSVMYKKSETTEELGTYPRDEAKKWLQEAEATR